jgi:hypothetical protein
MLRFVLRRARKTRLDHCLSAEANIPRRRLQ